MVVLGGTLFLLLGVLNSRLPQNTSLLLRGLLGGILITATEFAAGCVLNLGLGLAIWDYSSMPFQLLGQVCLPYSFLWVILAMVAALVYNSVHHLAWDGALFRCRLL